MVLSVNGDVIGARPALAARSPRAGGDFLDAAATGRALAAAAAGRPLRFGVPFPLSMHAALVDYWLAGSGSQAVSTSSPCRRRAWRRRWPRARSTPSASASPGAASRSRPGPPHLILPGAAIWQFAPEKVLAMPRATVEADPGARRGADARGLAGGALARRARQRDDRGRARRRPRLPRRRAGILERSSPAARRRRAAAPRSACRARSSSSPAPRLSRGAARRCGSPRRWPGSTGADRAAPARRGAASFRADLYRSVLGPIGADLPGASEKLEGAMTTQTAVASTLGTLVLGPDRFFDGRVFDPDGGRLTATHLLVFVRIVPRSAQYLRNCE